jgi:hypothetical protein
MKVSRQSIHRTTAAGCGSHRGWKHVGHGADACVRELMQIVTQSEHQPVTGFHAQRGGFVAIAVRIAVTDFAMIKEIAISNVHLKRAVLTAKIRWLGDFGPSSGARTDGSVRDLVRWNCGGKLLGIFAGKARFYSLPRASRLRRAFIGCVLAGSRPRGNRCATETSKHQQTA